MNIHKTFKRGELENLPSDQLDRMLHEELGKDTKNAALIMELMQILEEREAETPKPNVGGAWQIFVERYNTEIEELPAQRKRSPYRWIGGVAAAILLFLVVSFGVPKAVGHGNIIEMIASWTDDFFYLSRPDDTPPQDEYVFETDNPGLQQVYDAVVELGITDPVVPMWLPDGYELVELRNIPTSGGRKIFATFECNDADLALYFKISQNFEHISFPKDECTAENIELFGTTYSILPNNENTSVVWISGNAQCFLTTTEDQDTTTAIVESIYYGE